MEREVTLLCDCDGNLVFDELSSELESLQSYALCLDMLASRFDENSLELKVFFHCFKEFSSCIGQRLDELYFDYRLLHDFVFEGIPADEEKHIGKGA